MSLEKLLLVAGIVYILGIATPVGLLKLLARGKEEGCFLDLVLMALALPFAALLVALIVQWV